MGFKAYKQSKYVTYHDLPQEGAAATVTAAGTEMLDNFQTGQKDRFVVLEFKEFKPLVCKNPVLDALDEAFPQINDPTEIVGYKVYLIRSDERVAGQLHQLVRVDALKTMRANSQPAHRPAPGATISDRPPTPVNMDVPPPTENPYAGADDAGDVPF